MTTPADHEDRDHAIFAPSASARWHNCHGSVGLAKNVKEPATSKYAKEGTECHEAAANVLMGFAFDDVCEGLSDEQKWIVEEYTDYCTTLIDKVKAKFGKAQVWVEERVFSRHDKDYSGTADFAIVASRTAEIVDLKAGFMAVAVRNADGTLNPQLASYACLMLDTHDLWDKIEKVRITIVQPRCYERPQTTVADIGELYEFYDAMLSSITSIQKGATNLHAGDWCKYCPAKGRCPELRGAAVQAARMVFDDDHKAVPIRLYSPDELEAILAEADVIEAHLEGVRQHVRRELEKGRKFSGWKLVQKRAVSKWTDFNAALQVKGYQSFKSEDIYTMRPKSPKHIAQVLGVPLKELEPYFIKESSGTTLARADDPRPAEKGDPFGDKP